LWARPGLHFEFLVNYRQRPNFGDVEKVPQR